MRSITPTIHCTPTIVWAAYRALHRYVSAGGQIRSGVSIKKKPAKNLPPPYYDDCAAIAETVKLLQRETPIVSATPLYFSYLYLFVQLLRCSYKLEPNFMGQDLGWANLGWYPIHSLRGKEGSEAAYKAWNGWYHKNGKNTDAYELTRVYTYYASTTEVALAAVDRQLLKLMRELSLGGDVRGILAYGSPYGGARSDGEPIQWHPMFVLSRVESWHPDPDRLVEREVKDLEPWLESILENWRNCQLFVEKFVPAANLDHWPEKKHEILLEIRWGIDDLVRHGKELNRQKNAWSRLRKKYFPDDDG